jgi:hypothetical protein
MISLDNHALETKIKSLMHSWLKYFVKYKKDFQDLVVFGQALIKHGISLQNNLFDFYGLR